MGSREFQLDFKVKWPVGEYTFKVVVFDWVYVSKVYGEESLWNEQLVSQDLPFLIREYGVRQIWLPHTRAVAKLLAEHFHIFEELHFLSIAVEDPWANPLYHASKRCEQLYNSYETAPVSLDAWEEKDSPFHKKAPFVCLEHMCWSHFGVNSFATDTKGYWPTLPGLSKTRARTRASQLEAL